MRRGRLPSAAGALLVLVAVTACGAADGAGSAPPPAAAAARQLPPAAFAAAVAEPDRVTVNVHVPDEGRIEGTDLLLPYDRVQARAGELPADRATPLAVYCLTGRMSAEAAAALSDLGYRDVVELAGGMQAWQQAGRSLQQ